MRKLLALLFVSLAIPMSASDQYIYPPGDDSPIQHWQYPTLTAMNTDTGFYGQDVYKIAFNQQDGQFYYLSDPYTPTWLTFGGGGGGGGNVSNSGTPLIDQTAVWTDATHIKGVKTLKGGATNQYLQKIDGTDYNWTWAAGSGGGGSTTFIGLTDVPASYTGSANKLVAVNGAETGLLFTAVTGGGNVSNSGTPTTDQTAVWTDATHVKGVDSLTGGTGGQVLTKIDATPFHWNWATAPGGGGGGTVTNVATTAPILGGPITVTGTISLDAAKVTLWDTASADRLKWDGGTGAWFNATTGRTSLGLGGAAVLNVGAAGGVQGWDADLDALGALTGTNTIYYRSAANTWTAVTIGSNMTFTGGTLNSTISGGGGGDFSTNTSLSVNGELVLFADTSGKLGRRASATGIATVTSGVLGTIPDNHTNWDTAASQGRQWDGGGGAWLTPATARTTLQLNAVTNDIQTQAAIVPNTIPTDGQLLVGNTTNNKYFPRTITGSGATISVGPLGGITISNIANASLLNDTITIAATAVSLGGTITRDTILGSSTAGYLKHGATANTVSSIATIPNADLTNDTITIAATGVSLGGTITRDNVMGTTTGLGYVKRTAAQTYTATTTAIPNGDLANSAMTIATNAVSLGGTVTADQITGATGLGYMKRTAANTYTATTTSIPIADLASSAMTFANSAVSLGGTVTADNAIGLASGTGLVKRSGASNYTIAAAGTDYKAAGDSAKVVLITATGTYTPTAGVQALYVECVGGGGGGAGARTNGSPGASGGGPGGGGGGYAAAFIATPAASYAVTIGGAGAGGAATGGTGGTGGTTTFGTTSACTSTGGVGGTGVTSGAATTIIWGAPTIGGSGTVGSLKASGGDAGIAMSFGNSGAYGGSGGASHFAGMTGGGAGAADMAGSVGGGPGGGGSGACGVDATGAAGGAGAAGIVRVWEIF